METVLLDFQERVEEINRYFNFLEELINRRTRLCILDENDRSEIIDIDDDLAKTLKANSFLLLYNLVESSMRNAIGAIFDELKEKNISYNSLRIEIKKLVLQNFKKRSPDNVHERIRDISIDIITTGFNSRELFSGNIDRDEVTKTARNFGFSVDTEYSRTKHGASLRTIMTNRNNLAHGNRSFAEIGRNYSVEELRRIKEEVIAYLEQILGNIDRYIEGEEYLASSTDRNEKVYIQEPRNLSSIFGKVYIPNYSSFPCWIGPIEW